MMTFAKPEKSGVANISSIRVPCMVNSWLYCSLVSTICIPGWKSSRRMISAITPPMQKNMNEPMRYMYPIVLWSVDVIQLTIALPLLRGATGASRAASCSVAVIVQHLLAVPSALACGPARAGAALVDESRRLFGEFGRPCDLEVEDHL